MTDTIGVTSFRDYLGKCELHEHLQLTNELSFHWANWDQSCLALRKKFKNFNDGHYLMNLNTELNQLKYKSVWLCNKIKVVKTDLHSLYESYLDSRLRITWFERKDEILFSSESEQGPYFTLTSMRWFDHKIYSQFVMRKILLEQFSLRSFRLNSQIAVECKFDNDINIYSDKVLVHQISEVGFLLKFKDKNFLNKIKNSHSLEFKIPTQHYEEVRLLPIIDLMGHLNQESKIQSPSKLFRVDSKILNFYGNALNAKRSSSNEFYLFVRFEDLHGIGHELDLKKIFKPLVEKTKVHFLKTIDQIELERRQNLVA